MYPFVFFGYKFPDLGILAWVHLVPLFLFLKKSENQKQFRAIFLSLLIGYTGHLYWLFIAMREYGGLGFVEALLLLILLAAILSFYKSLFLCFAFWLHKLGNVTLAILIPVFLTLFDFSIHEFPFGGFPWILPAYSQGQWLGFLQWVSITGALGLSFLIYLTNALIAEGWHFFFHKKQFDKGVSRFVVVFVFGIFSLFLSFLSDQKFENTKKSFGDMQIGLVQANIRQDEKWSLKNLKTNLEIHEKLTFEASRDGAELVFWPESAFPYTLYEHHLENNRFLDLNQFPVDVFLGAVIKKREGERKTLFNSVLHVDRKARFVNRYDKMHLVPFGEYVPMKQWLPFVEKFTQAVGTFEPGTTPQLFKFKDVLLGALICYEDVFLDSARRVTQAGAQVLVNYTNDAWYENSSAQYQHLVMSQFRALENRKPLIRATNTGYTAIINAKGKVIDELPPFERKYLIHRLEVVGAESPFTGYGMRWMFWLGVVAVLNLIYALLRKNLLAHKKKS